MNSYNLIVKAFIGTIVKNEAYTFTLNINHRCANLQVDAPSITTQTCFNDIDCDIVIGYFAITNTYSCVYSY